jgi:glycosyltransferase involved in cell wall biosynthesis
VSPSAPRGGPTLWGECITDSRDISAGRHSKQAGAMLTLATSSAVHGVYSGESGWEGSTDERRGMSLGPRVLHVSQPVDGGVPAVVSSLVRDQCDRRYEVHVACPPGAGLAQQVSAMGQSHLHPWPATRSPGLSVVGEVIRLKHIVETTDPDLVVLHSAKAGLAGRLAVRGRRPTIFAPHAWSFQAARGTLARISTAWEIHASRWTDVMVCVSEDERTRGVSAGIGCSMRVVPNGVDVEQLTPRPAAPARTRLGLPERPIVVCVGRLTEQKGQDLLLAAWPSVVAAVPDAQLVLVGDGPQRATLASQAPEGVTFAGAREDVDDFLAAADVVVLPSRWEAGPLIPLEAMAMGRPVVAFAVEGVRAALGQTGVVLEAGDVPGLAKAITDLLRSPDAARAAGRAARDRALTVADRRHSLDAWNRVLMSVLDNSYRKTQ